MSFDPQDARRPDGSAKIGAADELLWRAFCYLHGELDAQEAEAFEEDLAVEQSAREALAQATELTAALHEAAEVLPAGVRDVTTSAPAATASSSASISLASRVLSAVRRSSGNQRLIAAGIAASVAIALTLAVSGFFRNRDHAIPGPADPFAQQLALAEAWADISQDEIWHDGIWRPAGLSNGTLSEGSPEVSQVEQKDGQDTENPAESKSSAEEDSQEPENEDAVGPMPSVPSWMLAAVDLQLSAKEEKKP